MQKYRFDITGDADANGAVPMFTKWIGGPTLAGVKNCPVDLANIAPRTVYITGEPDTYFSIPAVCKIQGCRVKGFVTQEDGNYLFCPNRF